MIISIIAQIRFFRQMNERRKYGTSITRWRLIPAGEIDDQFNLSIFLLEVQENFTG